MTRDDVQQAIDDLRLTALETIADSIAGLYEKGVLDDEDAREVMDMIAEGDIGSAQMYVAIRQHQYREQQPSLLERLWPFS